mmetsp:Transcript_9769/g.23914  ORF Transcript_9769/g.23914 Transcript_9769/m.23914 type:complete len:257 (+) Transcript_9769:1107-1877(+)
MHLVDEGAGGVAEVLLQRRQHPAHHVAGGADLVEELAHERGLHLCELSLLLRRDPEALFADFAVGVIADAAPGVAEGAIGIPVDVGVDQQLADRAVLGAEADRNVLDRVARPQRLENLQHKLLLVRAKVHDWLAEVLLFGVPEYVELRLVAPQHVPRPGEPVHGDWRVVEEVEQFRLLLLLRLVGRLAHAPGADDAGVVARRRQEPVVLSVDRVVHPAAQHQRLDAAEVGHLLPLLEIAGRRVVLSRLLVRLDKAR